jgi:Na+/H+-translocating membrane pyrophosphatase
LEFLTDWGVIIALLCAGAAVAYGVVTSRWLLSLPPGNEEMQAISHAVQEGATAYLRRQYTIIAGVAVVLAIVLAIALEASDAEGLLVAVGFLRVCDRGAFGARDRAALSRRCRLPGDLGQPASRPCDDRSFPGSP